MPSGSPLIDWVGYFTLQVVMLFEVQALWGMSTFNVGGALPATRILALLRPFLGADEEARTPNLPFTNPKMRRPRVSSVVQPSQQSARNYPAYPALSEFVRRLGYNFGYMVRADDKT
jgi:hypothetical protein